MKSKNTPTQVGIDIRNARKKSKMTMQQFADALGKTIETIYRYESGGIMPPADIYVAALSLGMVGSKTRH